MRAPKISDAEWEVMTALWKESPRSSAAIVEELAPGTTWSPKTVKTLLTRLVKKGFVATESQGNRYLYSPAVSRQETVREASHSFLERVFQGDAASLLLHFARSVDLSPEEARELRSLLDDDGRET